MNRKMHHFRQFSEDSGLFHLEQAAKNSLQHNERVIEIYQKYKDLSHEQSPREHQILNDLDGQLLFSPGPVKSRCKSQYVRMPSSPETKGTQKETLPKNIPDRKTYVSLNDKNTVHVGKDVNVFSRVKNGKNDSESANNNNQRYIDTDAKTELLARPAQYKMNDQSSQRNETITTINKIGKYSSPRTSTMLFKSMPRFIRSSTTEIETDSSYHSKEYLQPVSLSKIDNKNSRSRTGSNEEKITPNDMYFSMYETKAGIGHKESNLTSSLPAVKNYQNKCVNFGNPPLPCESSIRSDASKQSIEPSFYSFAHNFEPMTVIYCMKQLYKLLQLSHKYTNQFYSIVLKFQRDLNVICSSIRNIQCLSQEMLLITGGVKLTENLKNIFDTLKQASHLEEKINLWEIEIEGKKPFYELRFENVRKIETENNLHAYNDQQMPVDVFKLIKDVETIRQKAVDMIRTADSRIKLFFTTAEEFRKLVKLFDKRLIDAGILKKPLVSMM